MTPRPARPQVRGSVPAVCVFVHADVRVALAQTAWRNRHASIIERAADMDNASKDNDQPVRQSDDGSVIDVDLTAEYADDGAGKDADKVAKKDTDDYYSADIMGDETDDAAKTPTKVVSVGKGVDDKMDMGEDDMEEEADEVVEDVVEDEMVDNASSVPGVPVANEKIIPENVVPPAPRESAATVGHGNSDIPLLSEARRGLSGEHAEANELDLPRLHVERDDGAVAASSVKLVDAAEDINIAS
jgi:hypothetical protein